MDANIAHPTVSVSIPIVASFFFPFLFPLPIDYLLVNNLFRKAHGGKGPSAGGNVPSG